MRLCELKQKEVINICDGKRVGYISDIEFDLYRGVITHIIIPGQYRLFGMFGYEDEYIIPIKCIKQISDELILIEANLDKCVKKCYD